jgi:[acyl-carrier-protein] S-malonyltransferase
MFPGQSSRYPEMIENSLRLAVQSATLVSHASEILGRDLAGHFRGSNSAVFASNRDVQVGVFLANHLHLKLLEEAGIESAWSLGLSLGEYNHLVHIGALSFEEALPLVDERGRLYEAAHDSNPGVMVSLFPIDAVTVDRTIAALGLSSRVVVGLYNSPRQQVLTGEQAACEQVIATLEDGAYLEAVEIERRIPMHAPLFEPVARSLAAVLARTALTAPARPYVPNVLGEIVEGASPEQIRACLTAHVYRPVRWQQSVDVLAARLSSPCFLEVGPRAVLCNLFGRGWTPGRRAATDSSEEWADHFAGVTAELQSAP